LKLAAREWSKMRKTMDKMREEGARERLEKEREKERERESARARARSASAIVSSDSKD
jgi:hypothetical protein